MDPLNLRAFPENHNRGQKGNAQTFSQGGTPVSKPVKLSDVIRTAVEKTLGDAPIEVIFRIPDASWQVGIDAAQFVHVVVTGLAGMNKLGRGAGTGHGGSYLVGLSCHLFPSEIAICTSS